MLLLLSIRLQVAYRRYGPVPRRVSYLMGLAKALENYLEPAVKEQWQATKVDKRVLHETFNRDPMVGPSCHGTASSLLIMELLRWNGGTDSRAS